jgi:predicted MFS family arabinose efflux permease
MSMVSAVPEPTGPILLWRHRDFRRLFAGATVSRLGSEISELAIPLLVIITLDGTETEVGLVRTAQFLPFLLLTLHAGVLVDRLRRRPLMVTADLARFVLIGAIPALIWLGVDRMEPLYLLVFVAGAFTVIHQLADTAYLPSLIGPDQLMPANSRLVAAQSAADLSGQGIGGLLVAALSAPIAVLVDALSYLFSGLAVAGIRHREPAPGGHTPADRPPMRTEIADGIRYLFRGRYLRPLVGEAATYNAAYQVFIIGLLVWLVRDLRLSPALIGLVLSLAAVGAFAGAAAGAKLSTRYGFGATMLVTMAVGNGAPLALFAAAGGGPGTVVLLGGIFALMGFGTALANVHNVTLRQSAVPVRLQGRVNAAYRLVSWGVIPIGAVLGGLLAREMGAHHAALAGGVGVAAATLWVAVSPIPRLREAPRAADLAADVERS